MPLDFSRSPLTYQIGADIGGTFTDLVLLGSDGSLHTRKVLSTPDDYGRGVVAGIDEALQELQVGAEAVSRVVHATTVATNAILEHRGARVGLVTTLGFRDVLEMRRLRIPEMYTLNYPRPEPLVPRNLRLEVRGRIGPKGEEWTPLEESDVTTCAQRLRDAGANAVAVSLLHAYANPEHERRVARILRKHMPSETFISCSSDILPVIREYERTSTTVINAFLGPTLRKYFDSLRAHLRTIGIHAQLQVMKSDGGIMSVDTAIEKPAYLIESGPAAGVIGAARFGELMQLHDCISLDMGGTTAKAAMVEAGEVPRTGDYEVGAGINLSSRLVMGGGYALKLPVIDISEIGAGGGSLVEIDSGGLLRVGPRSAGSSPGPVAYNFGGTEPTFTDAVLSLGYLNPDSLIGGNLRLNTPKAREVLEQRIAKPLGTELMKAAFGVFEIACGTMTRAVKAVTTYRGRDPRDFALFGFGGNGPVVAAHIAGMLEMRRVVIPPHPGVFSAFGLLMSDIEHEIVQGYMQPLAAVNAQELDARFKLIEADLWRSLAVEDDSSAAIRFTRFADCRYVGQAHELTVTVDEAAKTDIRVLAESFAVEHERTYGHRSEAESVECVTIRVIGRIVVERGSWLAQCSPPALLVRTVRPNRPAYFGDRFGLMETPVLARADLIDHARDGPLIIEEYDATVIVPPQWRARVDDHSAIHLEMK